MSASYFSKLNLQPTAVDFTTAFLELDSGRSISMTLDFPAPVSAKKMILRGPYELQSTSIRIYTERIAEVSTFSSDISTVESESKQSRE
jgi:hypothetical protein